MDAAATINFKSAEARRLFEGGYYSRAVYTVSKRWSEQNAQLQARRTIQQWRARWKFYLESVVCRHHVYKAVWTPFFLTAITEPENNHDRHAVCEERERNRRSLTARAVADGVARLMSGHTPW